jgi:hypothetical protein
MSVRCRLCENLTHERALLGRTTGSKWLRVRNETRQEILDNIHGLQQELPFSKLQTFRSKVSPVVVVGLVDHSNSLQVVVGSSSNRSTHPVIQSAGRLGLCLRSKRCSGHLGTSSRRLVRARLDGTGDSMSFSPSINQQSDFGFYLWE